MERKVEHVRFRNLAVPKQKRVAAYARVSIDKDAMRHSLAAQVSRYSNMIQNHPGWHYAGVYADYAQSGTKNNRDEFNRLLADCSAGKIDMIITKSISRFARNTVTLLETIRDLKEMGVDVYFEEQNIHTLSSDGELMLTLLASFAQEESRSISENVTWGQRKRFADGKVSLPYKAFLGYRKGENGLPQIVPEEAEIVREIYRLLISGRTVNYIAKHLTDRGIPTPRGKQKWQSSTVESILTNEKYKGAALLQKKFTVDFLKKKMKVNEGEVPQYYVEHSHPAIIEPVEWEQVQQEMARRKALGKHRNSLSAFSSKIICGDCGAFYGSKLWHSNSKYRRTVWQCNHKFSGEHKCTTPHLYEGDIKRLFMAAIDELYTSSPCAVLAEGDEALSPSCSRGDSSSPQKAGAFRGPHKKLIATCELAIAELTDTDELDNHLSELLADLDVLQGRIERMIVDQAASGESDFNSRYTALAEKYESLRNEYDKNKSLRAERVTKRAALEAFLMEIQSADTLPITYSDRLWLSHIDHATVHSDGRIIFTFKNGMEISKEL